MPVHEPHFTAYRGPLTPGPMRIFAMLRQGLRSVLARKLVLVLLAACGLAPLGFASALYLRHNAEALAILGVSPADLPPFGASFYLIFLRVQGVAAFLVTLAVAPGAISGDVRHNALPLYLYRPIDRWEYVLGKGGLLGLLLSAVTLLPGLLLLLFQASLEGASWVLEHWTLAAGVVVACLVYVATMSLLGLATSSLARSRPAAGVLFLLVMFLSLAFSGILAATVRDPWPLAFSVPHSLLSVWQWCLGTTGGLVAPVAGSWLSLATLAALSIAVLARRIRAVEVVR